MLAELGCPLAGIPISDLLGYSDDERSTTCKLDHLPEPRAPDEGKGNNGGSGDHQARRNVVPDLAALLARREALGFIDRDLRSAARAVVKLTCDLYGIHATNLPVSREDRTELRRTCIEMSRVRLAAGKENLE